MNERNDGGPAFPRDHAHDGHNGMDLRDYFAAKAMQGELACQSGSQQITSKLDITWLAQRSYEIADAMLKARAS